MTMADKKAQIDIRAKQFAVNVHADSKLNGCLAAKVTIRNLLHVVLTK
jgi:hypothetical protein